MCVSVVEIPFRKKFSKPHGRLIREQKKYKTKQNDYFFATSFSSWKLEKPGCKRLLKLTHRDTKHSNTHSRGK